MNEQNENTLPMKKKPELILVGEKILVTSKKLVNFHWLNFTHHR